MRSASIAVIDSGCGNVNSLVSMLMYIGASPCIVTEPRSLSNFSHIIIPGVGSFDNAVKKLLPFKDALSEAVFNKKAKILGICVGMQVMFSASEEGVEKGFDWLEGRLELFNFDNLKDAVKLKVPHMGWNTISVRSQRGNFFPTESFQKFYFAHSYFVNNAREDQIIATSVYGIQFPCCFNYENITAVQFHPEKSHMFGMEFLKRYVGCDIT